MDVKELKEIEDRANKAAPEPWVIEHENVVCKCRNLSPTGVNSNLFDSHEWNKNNSIFIAHARTDVPKLIAALREERKRREEAERKLKEMFTAQKEG